MAAIEAAWRQRQPGVKLERAERILARRYPELA